MTIKELQKRVERLQAAALIILCRMPDGTERECTVMDAIASGGEFIRVVHGNDLNDVRLVLDHLLAPGIDLSHFYTAPGSPPKRTSQEPLPKPEAENNNGPGQLVI